MARSIRHIARGIEAVIDSTHFIGQREVWVDTEDVSDVLHQLQKLTGEEFISPRVYKDAENRGRVCIELRF